MTQDAKLPAAEAPAQTAGVLFQLRYALYRALERARRDPTGLIGIERIDDVLLEDQAGVRAIEQVKHSVTELASFSDYSFAVWRTLGNWARLTANRTIDLGRVEFLLVTNATIPEATALGFLPYGDQPRHPTKAIAVLRQAASSSTNKATEGDRKDFLNLSDVEQNALVAAIRVVPVTGLGDFTFEIESALHYICDPTQLADLTSELEGWWIQRLSDDLGKGRGAVIAFLELEARVAYLREKYKLSNLPIDQDDPSEDPETLAGYIFVDQLRVLDVREGRIRNAQSDFLRARAQRSKWVREARVDPAEMNNYDRSLCDFWRTRFAIMADEITDATSEDDKRRAGRNLLAWAETQIVPLRGAQAQFLTSGSYHALADEVRVGWHPDYEQKFPIGKK